MKRIRCLSLLLTLLLLVSLLPVTASAVYVVDRLECYTAMAVVGQPLALRARAPEEAPYSVRPLGWYVGAAWENARPAEENELATRSDRYWLQVEFTPDEAYMFMQDTGVFCNGRPADAVEYVDAGTFRAVVGMEAGYMGVGDVPLQVTPPYAGQTPDYRVHYPYTHDYSASVKEWRKGPSWQDAQIMTAGEPFVRGETYWVTLWIRPSTSFLVGEPHRVTVNGSPISSDSYWDRTTRDFFAICGFSCRQAPILTEVSVTVTEPEATQGLSYRVATEDETKYTAYVGDWYLGSDWATAVPQKDEAAFKPGADYWVRVVVNPEFGCEFPADLTDVTMTINGLTAEHLYFNEIGGLNGAVRLHCPSSSYVLIFTDLPADAYYTEAVDWAVEEGITSGTTPTTYSPHAPCTRAQAVSFLWRQAGCPRPRLQRNPFTDVPASAYYADAVLWAVEKGITRGLTSTTFGPNVTCTRAQIVSFLWNREGRPTVSGRNPFTDVASGKYYRQAVLWAVNCGITQGVTDTTFAPDAPCTRAQIACFLFHTPR